MAQKLPPAQAKAGTAVKGKEPKVYNAECGGSSKYMQSGVKFGVLTPEMIRSILEEQ